VLNHFPKTGILPNNWRNRTEFMFGIARWKAGCAGRVEEMKHRSIGRLVFRQRAFKNHFNEVFSGKANRQVKARRTRGVLVLRYHIPAILSSAFQLSARDPEVLTLYCLHPHPSFWVLPSTRRRESVATALHRLQAVIST